MADNAPWFLFMSHRDEVHGLPASNGAMVEDLVHSGSLRSPECTLAFQAVDRQHFWPAGSGELAYADMPLRSGKLHLSAPHIYAKALESLMPLRPGMSFLNVGSGTGYFNSIVAELIGPMATNHGVDIWPETVAHATQRCGLLGKSNIEFKIGNVYQLHVGQTMRYNRIYMGACANSKSKYLYRLLEVGGVLIGPFQVGHTQQLRRVVRQTENQFSVEVLGSVQFASLVEPAPPPPAPSMTQPLLVSNRGQNAIPSRRRSSTSSGATDDSSQALGLPGVPFTFSLQERPWTPERCWLYPPSFRNTVTMGLLCRPQDASLPCIPTEIWIKHIFPWCPKWWFEPPRYLAASTAPTSGSEAGGVAGDCDMTLPQRCGVEGEDAEQSDDGGSTRAPSRGGHDVEGGLSRHGTPEQGPSNPPIDIEVGDVHSASSDSAELGDVIFEVFGNGQRHAIGTENDPDDMEPDDGPRLEVPMRVLQLLASNARRRRRTWQDMEPPDEEEGGQNEDEDEMADAEEAAPAQDSDDEMQGPDEGELSEVSDMGML